jgi:hypothetical protein
MEAPPFEDKTENQLYIVTDGEEIIERRIRTEPERFAAVLGPRPPCPDPHRGLDMHVHANMVRGWPPPFPRR